MSKRFDIYISGPVSPRIDGGASAAASGGNPQLAALSVNVSNSVATLSWESMIGAQSYAVRIREKNAAAWTILDAATVQTSIAEMLADGEYIAQVQANYTQVSGPWKQIGFEVVAGASAGFDYVFDFAFTL